MEQYTIKMDNFEGPLDLLCHLIDKNKMDICDIKIVDITDQYLEYLSSMQGMNLDITSEFIVMASKLIYLKSKSLLPSVIEDDEDENEIDLIQMLIEYKKYKEFTVSLKERGNIYGERFFKAPDKVEFPKEKLNKEYSKDLIPQIYNDFVNIKNSKQNEQAQNIERLAASEKVTILSKVREILKEFFTKPSFVFNKLFNPRKRPKIEIVTAFFSLLELSRKNRISVTQDKLFGDINVTKIKRQR